MAVALRFRREETARTSKGAGSFLGRRNAGDSLVAQERRIRRSLKVIDGPDVQLLARAAAGREGLRYLRVMMDREWRGQPYSTAAWPAELASGQVAVLLLARAPGRVGLAAGRQRELDEPFLGVADGDGLDPRRMAISMVADCIAQRAGNYAPPVLELFTGRGLDRREILLPGLDWPLPVADGV